MTRAAEQCRIYLEEKYPDIRIGRFACRDTASGGISQHSAYDGYDSNAMDLKAPTELGRITPEQTAYLQVIVDDLNAHLDEWSGRKILWQVARHYDHAHIDFYPMITMHKWCGGPETPDWELSNGQLVHSRDPDPENGTYNGPDEEDEMTFATWIVGWVEGLAEDKAKARQEFQRLYDDRIIEGDENTVDYWVGLLDDPTNNEWPGFYARTELSVWGR